MELGYGQVASLIEIVSIHQPGDAVASSVPNRNRKVTVCPARFGPILILVVMKPLEFALHAIRPESGLEASPLISPV